MTSDPLLPEVERFRSFLISQFGLDWDGSRLGGLLLSRLDEKDLDEETYLRFLEQGNPAASAWREEVRILTEALSVPESFFFRDPAQFEVIRLRFLPSWLESHPEGGTLRILSAGCAGGEEPYSLAILFADSLPRGRRAEILGVDMSPRSIEKARRGVFTEWSLRTLPESARRRWFREEKRHFLLSDEIRGKVDFEERNLAVEDDHFWQSGRFDLVLCRNTLMYFHASSARRLVSRIERSLASEGLLFLGHAESMRGLSQGFHVRHTDEAFYYQRRGSAPAEAFDRAGTEAAQTPSAPTPEPGLPQGWAESISQSAGRIRKLTQASLRPESPQGAESVGGSVDTASSRLERAMELVDEERFGEALGHLDHLPGGGKTEDDSPERLLLRASLLTHQGRFEAAEQTCRKLLECDDLSAGAHYLLALCRSAAGDREAAVGEAQVSAYLDPTFSMPRLHLGLLARQSGDLPKARREFDQALTLLQQEEPSRLLLFGGGFRREGLLTLCRSELAALSQRESDA
jgi:chemotaxis protein methyltransferase CheR